MKVVQTNVPWNGEGRVAGLRGWKAPGAAAGWMSLSRPVLQSWLELQACPAVLCFVVRNYARVTLTTPLIWGRRRRRGNAGAHRQERSQGWDITHPRTHARTSPGCHADTDLLSGANPKRRAQKPRKASRDLLSHLCFINSQLSLHIKWQCRMLVTNSANTVSVRKKVQHLCW